MGVMIEVDASAFPMSVAEKLLSLGEMLSMGKGPTAYFEAEKSLIVWLESLSVYHKVLWPEIAADFRLQQRAVERFITLHRHNCDRAHNAQLLLAFMSYFPAPVAEPKYLETLDESERQA